MPTEAEGLDPTPSDLPAQLVSIDTESGAVHNPDGWFPVVNVTLENEVGESFSFAVVVGEATDLLLRDLRDATRAARRDLSVARARGIIS